MEKERGSMRTYLARPEGKVASSSGKPSEGRQQKCWSLWRSGVRVHKHMVDSMISPCSVFRLCQATTTPIQPHMRHESHLELLLFAPVLLTSPDMEDTVFPFLLCVCLFIFRVWPVWLFRVPGLRRLTR